MGIEQLEIRLSGGASNTNPTTSYGGAMSTVSGGLVLSQSVTLSASIPGVDILDAAGNATGAGTLYYVAASKTLAWQEASAVSSGTPVDIGTAGTYLIRGLGTTGGYIVIEVTNSVNLSISTNYSPTATIANQQEKIFDDVSKDEAYAGLTDYRCLYVKNASASTATNVQIILEQDAPGVDSLTIRGPAAAVNTAETSNIAGPGGTFYGFNVPVTIGNIPAGQYWGFWIKREVPALTVDGFVADSFKIKLTARL